MRRNGNSLVLVACSMVLSGVVWAVFPHPPGHAVTVLTKSEMVATKGRATCCAKHPQMDVACGTSMNAPCVESWGSCTATCRTNCTTAAAHTFGGIEATGYYKLTYCSATTTYNVIECVSGPCTCTGPLVSGPWPCVTGATYPYWWPC